MEADMLDLELLKSFVSVVDAGGFTRAGERVHRTQSTVSQQIRRLEEDLGQTLLNRNGKDVSVTEPHGALMSGLLHDIAGAVRLGLPEDFAAYRLPRLLGAF